MSGAEEAIRYYQKRFRIETFFSDQKSRGFNIQKSHLEDPQRLSRLLIALCLAYIWLVYLGVLCKTEGWQSIIHRKSRCDLSLFQSDTPRRAGGLMSRAASKAARCYRPSLKV